MNIRNHFLKFALVLIPLYTIALASNASWINYNLSVVGNYFDKRISFTVWGVVTAVFFTMFIKDLYFKAGIKAKRVIVLLNVAIGLFVASVLLPYLPDVLPTISFFHEICAFVSPFFLLVAIYIFVSQLNKRSGKHFSRSMLYLGLIVLISMLLLFAFGIVTSLLEVFVVIATVVFLWDLSKRLENTKK